MKKQSKKQMKQTKPTKKQRWVKPTPGLGDGLRHGSRSTYINYGCRCSDCRAAVAAYGKAWRRREQWVEKLAVDVLRCPTGLMGGLVVERSHIREAIDFYDSEIKMKAVELALRDAE